MTDVVYFVRRDALVKIGTTGGLPHRIRTLSKGGSGVDGMRGDEVELLATMPGGRPVEKALHEMFASLRYAKEWFFLEEPLVGFIRAVAAAETLARARQARAFPGQPTPWAHVEEFVVPPRLRTETGTLATPANELVNLHEAAERGLVPLGYHALRKRLLRARNAGQRVPEPIERDGTVALYRTSELVAWVEGNFAP